MSKSWKTFAGALGTVAVMAAGGAHAADASPDIKLMQLSVGKIELLQGRESQWHPLSELTPASNQPMVPAMRTIQIIGGRKEKIRAGDVLGAMTRDFGYSKEQIGKINVNDFSTYVAVSRDIAHQAVDRLNSGRVKGKTVKARLL